LTFEGPCIVIYFYSKTNQMHNISNLFYFGTTFYMFRAVFPSIIRSLRLYIQHQYNDLATSRTAGESTYSFRPGRRIPSAESRPVQGPNQLPIQGAPELKRPGHYADPASPHNPTVFYSKTNQMHSISNLFYFGTTLYMFRTVFPSIIRSLSSHRTCMTYT